MVLTVRSYSNVTLSESNSNFVSLNEQGFLKYDEFPCAKRNRPK